MAQREYTDQEIIDLEYQGHGIAKPDGRVVFVEGVLPDENVDLRITRRKRDHAFAVPTVWHRESPRRVTPFCEHFADCGGCTWQYLPYSDQVEWKGRFVRDVLARLGGIADPAPLPVIPCETSEYYRNKLDYSFAPKRWITQAEVEAGSEIQDRRALGFHVKGRFDRVLEIRHCYLQPDPSNMIRDAAREVAIAGAYTYHDPASHTGFLRGVIIRTTRGGEVMVILVVGEDRGDLAARFLGSLAERVPAITSMHYIINTTRNDDVGPHEAHHVSGSRVITEQCGPLSLVVHPKSFYQTNSAQAERLYQVVRDWAELDSGTTLLDLYCGIGSIGMFVADRCRRVVGVEYVEEAVACARENAATNGITNMEFHAGDVRELLARFGRPGPAEQSQLPSPDVVVVDPPRAGVHPDVITELLRLAPSQIIYVSCKPSTQARDLARLSQRYEIRAIQPVDMFPHTFHIENVVDLRLRGEDE